MIRFSMLLALPVLVSAQDLAPKDSERDPVLSALLEADPLSESNGSVVLEAPDGDEPLLVTGNLPDETSSGALASREAEGVTVEVEPGRSNARVATSEIRIVAPFPAKPLVEPPLGWHLTQPDDVPPIAKTVTLANGSEIKLSIRPHVLVPDADGDRVIGIPEPGFDAALQYDQRETVGSILADSIASLDQNAERLGAAARRLDELLTSLPGPPAEDIEEPTENP